MVHLYPCRGAFVPGVPHVEQDVTEAQARELLDRPYPPAFTADQYDPERINPEARPTRRTKPPEPEQEAPASHTPWQEV